jgi:homocysteine S-methyltransferase
MAKYRGSLPQLDDRFFLADGGIETTLIFNDGLDLPHFAAFHLLRTEEGRGALTRYFDTYAALANRFGVGLVLESPTWRASADWGDRLGYNAREIADANSESVRLLEEVRERHESDTTPIVISGCVGPRGDGYVPDALMTAEQSEKYHLAQLEGFADSEADMACAMTMNYFDEALGIARGAQRTGLPLAVAFTVETDGNLPTGDTLQSVVERIDEETGGYPSYYMINCAHPEHFQHVVEKGNGWRDRIRGLRANASRRSHAELNDSPDVDAGNPVELAAQYARLRENLTRLNVMGGCCGTDHRHIEQIAIACAMA